MAKTMVSFSVDMESICRLGRQMLWEEGKDIEYCIELIESLMEHPDIDADTRRKLAIEILEGRKIIVGVNEGELIEDGEHIRPIYELVKRKEEELNYKELVKHMETQPFLYIDNAAGGYSIQRDIGQNWFSGKVPHEIQAMSVSEIVMLRKFNTADERFIDYNKEHKGVLEAGTYLLTDTRLAHKILKKPVRTQEEATDRCTKYYNGLLKKWKEEGIEYWEMDKYQKAIYERNQLVDKQFPYREVKQKATESINSLVIPETVEEPIVVDESLDYGSEEYEVAHWRGLLEREKKENAEDWYKYLGKPDEAGNPMNEYSWIDPNGVYYSAGFGGHSMKCCAIVMENPIYRKELFEERKEEREKYVPDYEIAEKILFKYGWAKLHDPSGSMGLHLQLGDGQMITLAQQETTKNIATHFELGYNPLDCSHGKLEEKQTGLIGWLDPKGVFHPCEWGEHYIFAEQHYDAENAENEQYVKLASHKWDIKKSYAFIPPAGLTDVQQQWFAEHFHELDAEQQSMVLDYYEVKEEDKTMEELKESFYEQKELWSNIYQMNPSLELHDWIALGLKIEGMFAYSNRHNELQRLCKEWTMKGNGLLAKQK